MNLCKPLNPVSFMGNISQSWKYFVNQLYWLLAGKKTASKSGEIKIRIMLSHAGKEAREVYKMLPWAAEGDEKKFDCDKSVPSLLQTTKNVLYERYCFWNL